jgi:hypothetical protein
VPQKQHRSSTAEPYRPEQRGAAGSPLGERGSRGAASAFAATSVYARVDRGDRRVPTSRPDGSVGSGADRRGAGQRAALPAAARADRARRRRAARALARRADALGRGSDFPEVRARVGRAHRFHVRPAEQPDPLLAAHALQPRGVRACGVGRAARGVRGGGGDHPGCVSCSAAAVRGLARRALGCRAHGHGRAARRLLRERSRLHARRAVHAARPVARRAVARARLTLGAGGIRAVLRARGLHGAHHGDRGGDRRAVDVDPGPARGPAACCSTPPRSDRRVGTP